MSTPFQNRLVGTIIVAAAAVIFLPSFFDGEKKAYQAQFEAIPQGAQKVELTEVSRFDHKPFTDTSEQTQVADINADDQKLDLTAAAVQATAIKPVTNDKATSASQTEVVEVKPLTSINSSNRPKVTPAAIDKSKSYALQLGSYKNQNNVALLLSKLKQAGYTVYTKPINTASGTLTKVLIGPEVSKTNLENKIADLKALTGVQGRVVEFTPIDG
ncbi:SPOR domain-containing protein [Thalassotalea maritima]|uniref:SPOR domain-containing protein n=1 Tax=Thalassotalea maritima TaxID=3242416 RepID=UPI003529A074